MTYRVTVKQWPFNKKYICKGHQTKEGFLILTLEDERKIFVGSSYQVEFSTDLFKLQLADIERESLGEAKIKHGLKNS